MESTKDEERSRREWLGVAVVTLIGFGIRSWPIGRFGLTHFDEGLYALVASWSLLPRGLAGIDPMLIPYAPPGYPILGGLAYWFLGRSDGAMIAVSQVAGTLTIPVVAWLARRTFGPGAAFAAATFCAFSGPHVAFSRMALTDASFLLAWLLAIGAGMLFLERPGFARAVVMGLAVGLAQQFKYNGWLTGGIVVASAAWGIASRPEERNAGSILRTFGCGGLAAGIAWFVVWPWYAFVEGHGGYSALLRHQQGYLGGWRDWWPHFEVQAEQAIALSDFAIVVPNLLLACLTTWIGRSPEVAEARSQLPPIRRFFSTVRFGVGAYPYILAPYWLGLILAPWLLRWNSKSGRLVGVWWLVLSVMTPFYHPYARLWLPYHAANWLLLGWLVTQPYAAWLESLDDRPKRDSSIEEPARLMPKGLLFRVLFAVGFVVFLTTWRHQPWPQSDLLAPSDSLYRATLRVAEILPREVQGLRLLARPPVTFYLAGRVELYPLAGSDSLLKGGDPRAWALVDSAILRSEAGGDREVRNLLDRLAKNWDVVEEIPTTPSLPTLLDLDPGVARSSASLRDYPLWLLRPRTPKALR